MNQIRDIQLSDISAILTIEQQDLHSSWSETLIKDCLNREHYYNWVLVDENTVKGYIICTIVAQECQIMNIAVHPYYHRQGLGEILLTYAINHAKGLAQRVILEVREHNVAAYKLYEKLGFKKIGIRPNYYQKGENNRNAWVYCLLL